MIQCMIENDLLAKLNLDNIPNIKNMDSIYMEQSRSFDPTMLTRFPMCGYGGNPVQQNHGARTCGQLGYSLGF